MDADALTAAYPRLFHVAAAGSWESLRQHGLRRTNYILAKGGLSVATADRLLHERRPKPFTFEHPELGQETLRDHKPTTGAARTETATPGRHHHRHCDARAAQRRSESWPPSRAYSCCSAVAASPSCP